MQPKDYSAPPVGAFFFNPHSHMAILAGLSSPESMKQAVLDFNLSLGVTHNSSRLGAVCRTHEQVCYLKLPLVFIIVLGIPNTLGLRDQSCYFGNFRSWAPECCLSR